MLIVGTSCAIGILIRSIMRQTGFPALQTTLIAIALWAGTLQSATANCEIPADTLDRDHLVVATLNIAHGRKDARNQMFLDEEQIRGNLQELASLMDRAEADMIALQEADAPSWWSGKFNHVEFLGQNSVYPCYVHGVHASNRMYDFGTALISRHALQDARVHSFTPSWPTTTKGFSLARLPWNPSGMLDEPLMVTFVSVHLDFSRRSVRRAQIEEMIRELGSVEGPMILMGDFNTDWLTRDSSLKFLAENLDLAVYEPHAEGLATYGEKGARLDWILITKDLQFRRYAVYPDIVSDHYAVAAEIELGSNK
jgi:endonuclease/exonuclease/phosphatase family metal-dependent hydrolase